MLGWPKSSAASNKNYYGIVRRVALLSDDGSFVVTVNTDAFDDCAYKYAYFLTSNVGAERIKWAYAMVMTGLFTILERKCVMGAWPMASPAWTAPTAAP